MTTTVSHKRTKLFTPNDETGVFSPWSIGHFALGTLASGLGIPIVPGVVLHQIWEVYENSSAGSVRSTDSWRAVYAAMDVTYGDYDGDSAVNTAGDTLSATLGMLFGWVLRVCVASSIYRDLILAIFLLSSIIMLICSTIAVKSGFCHNLARLLIINYFFVAMASTLCLLRKPVDYIPALC